MKKYAAAAAAVCVIFGGVCVHAKYYQDLKTESFNVDKNINGSAFISFYNNESNDLFSNVTFDESGKICIERGNDKIEMQAGKETALFNGEEIELPGAPYIDKSYAYVPARQTAEFFGYHLKYEDWSYNRFSSPKITLMSGDDLRKASGVVGNSYFEWSMRVPEGFFVYSDSVDSNIVTFDNFDGVEIKIEMRYPSWEKIESCSLNLEDYLERNELYEAENGNVYYVQGKVYSNPTEQNRALLNSVMDTFQPEYDGTGIDTSNISESGNGWDYCCKAAGLSFEMPVTWDTYAKRGYTISAGYEYGSRLHMTNELYKGELPSKEQVEKLLRYCSGSDAEAEERVYGQNKCIYSEQRRDNGYYIHAFVSGSGYTHHLIFRISTYEKSEQEMEYYINEMRADIEQVLTTLSMITPEAECQKLMIPGECDDKVEVDAGGYKFYVPEYLKVTDLGIYIIIEYPRDMMNFGTVSELVIFYDLDGEKEDMSNAKLFEINGLNFYKNKSNTVYLSEDQDIYIQLLEYDVDSEEYKNDLKEVMNSVHR